MLKPDLPVRPCPGAQFSYSLFVYGAYGHLPVALLPGVKHGRGHMGDGEQGRTADDAEWQGGGLIRLLKVYNENN